jgi:hypothetical protein
MRAAIHTRVRTTDQKAEMQVRELNEYAARQGWDVYATYQDVTSGAKVEPAWTGPACGCSDEELMFCSAGNWTDLAGRWSIA